MPPATPHDHNDNIQDDWHRLQKRFEQVSALLDSTLRVFRERGIYGDALDNFLDELIRLLEFDFQPLLFKDTHGLDQLIKSLASGSLWEASHLPGFFSLTPINDFRLKNNDPLLHLQHKVLVKALKQFRIKIKETPWGESQCSLRSLLELWVLIHDAEHRRQLTTDDYQQALGRWVNNCMQDRTGEETY